MDTADGDHRPLVREATLEEYRKEPLFAKEEEPPKELTLYQPYPYDKEDYAWGMAIDLNGCVGCNNCIVACQSENNIAVVGKEQVESWTRTCTGFASMPTIRETAPIPRHYFQPVPCMQCENAPCEVVCPVGATVALH